MSKLTLQVINGIYPCHSRSVFICQTMRTNVYMPATLERHSKSTDCVYVCVARVLYFFLFITIFISIVFVVVAAAVAVLFLPNGILYLVHVAAFV